MRSFLLLPVLPIVAMAAACSGTNATCDELDCDDGDSCTEDSCSPATGACESVVKADWAPCDLNQREGACISGVCAELEWPSTHEELERIKASCANRSIETCVDDARCGKLTAGRFDPNLVCLEESAEVGCTSQFQLCGQSFTAGESPVGELHLFPSTCLPRGWTFAGSDLRAQQANLGASSCEWVQAEWPSDDERQTIREECEMLSRSGCYGRDECRAIYPWRVDDERMCLELSGEHVVCTSRFRVCDPTPTVARNPEGEWFVIANDCVLESWTIIGSQDGPESDVFSWPTCAPQP